MTPARTPFTDPKAAILAIGTEVTSGEIVNSNASWLAENLESCGINVPLHMAVPDDRVAILDALVFAAARVNFIFTIGGLGPTTDDFTRDVITEWAGLKTDFDAPSWQRIALRFEKLGITAPDSNRQQCFFPKSSRIHLNTHGSANGFSVTTNGVQLTALPGPPRELQGIWNEHLGAEFKVLGNRSAKPRLHTWTCLGVPESTLAEQVEAVMEGSGLQLGYRASAPLVHVKVWVPHEIPAPAAPAQDTISLKNRRFFSEIYLKKLDAALAPVCVARDGADHLKNLKAKLASHHGRSVILLRLHDNVTDGMLANRLAELLRPLEIPFSMLSNSGILNSNMSDFVIPSAGKDPFLAGARSNSEHGHNSELRIDLISGSEGPSLHVAWGALADSRTYLSPPLPAASDLLQINRTRLLLTERVLIDLGHIISLSQ